MELLSILNPPITDVLNDPRLSFEGLVQEIDRQQNEITKKVGEMAKLIKREDIKPFEGMMFALLQHHLLVTTAQTKLVARQTHLTYQVSQLNFKLEKLTKWLIGLTIVLGVLALPLAIEVLVKWFKG